MDQPKSSNKTAEKQQENRGNEMRDQRKPVATAARQLIDEALMVLTDQQRTVRAIINGHLSDAETFKQIAIIVTQSYEASRILKEVESIGVKG